MLKNIYNEINSNNIYLNDILTCMKDIKEIKYDIKDIRDNVNSINKYIKNKKTKNNIETIIMFTDQRESLNIL